MVIFGYLVLFLIFLCISRRKFHKWINTVSVFTFLWCFFGAISSLGLFYMRIPDIKIHQYAWLFVTSVNIPFLGIVKKHEVFQDKNNSVTEKLNDRGHIVVLVQLFALLMLTPLLFKMLINFVSYGSLTLIRQYFFSGEVFSSVYLDLLFRQLPFGMLQGLIVYYVFYSIKCKSFRHVIFAIINTLLATIVSGGRYPVMLLIYSMIVVLIMEDKKIHIKNRFSKRIKIIIAISVIFMLAVTLNRGQAIVKSIVVYFSGSFSFLDYIVSSPKMFALDQKTYGYLLFGAIFEPVVLALKVLGLTNIKVPQWHFNTYCQSFYNIGTPVFPIYYNNNTSIIYYLLRDCGVWGIILGGLFIGILLSKLHNQTKKGKLFSSLVYIYMINTLFNTVMTHQFFGTIPLFVLLTLLVCSSGIRIRIKI
jgi:oligosaccharide repeat unit polymerase